MTRACLHCTLVRALGAETEIFAARGVTVRARVAGPIFLPVAGADLYRRLRRMLAAAAAVAVPSGTVKLAVLESDGKSHVEVYVVVPSARGPRLLSCHFPRQDVRRLALGFAEQA